MKTLACVLILLAMASPLFANTMTLSSENWDGPGWSDWATVAGTNGWTGSSNPGVCLYTYDAAAVDSGRSAGPTGSSTNATADIEHSITPPSNLTGYTLTATLWAPATDGTSRCAIDLGNSHDPNSPTMDNLYVALERGLFAYGCRLSNDLYFSATQITTPVDVKIAATDAGSTFSYRLHGASTWTVGYTGTLGAGNLSSYNQVVGWLYNNNYGNIDSIVLTATTVPEPTTLTLLVAGLTGLLAYAWRRRK